MLNKKKQSIYACLSFRQDERMIQVKCSSFYLVELHFKNFDFSVFHFNFFVEKVQWYDFISLCMLFTEDFVSACFRFSFLRNRKGAIWGGVNLFISVHKLAYENRIHQTNDIRDIKVLAEK